MDSLDEKHCTILTLEHCSLTLLYYSVLCVSIYRDRKRKKFVRDGDKEGQKRVKTESGSYVPSSYKAGLYPNMERVNPILLLLVSIPRNLSLYLPLSCMWYRWAA